MGPTNEQLLADLEAEKARRVRAEELLDRLLGGDTPPVMYGRVGPGDGVPCLAIEKTGGAASTKAIEGRLVVLLDEYLGVS